MIELEKRLAQLSPEKLELLRERLRQEQEQEPLALAAPPPLPEIVPRPDDRYLPFPLTEVQEAYWIGRSPLFDLNRGATSYMEYEITGVGELGDGFSDRLEWAVQEFIGRHDVLRLVVLPDGRQQVLSEVPPFHIGRVNLRGRAAPEVEAALRAVRDRMRDETERIDRWPLFEILVHYLEENRVRVHLRFDALLKEGRSRSILLQELTLLFADPDADLAPLSCSYRDFAIFREELERSELFRRSEAYWQERLPALPPGPQLPLRDELSDRTPTRFTGRNLELLPTEEWRRIKTRAAQAGLTPSIVVLTAFADVVSAWSETPRFTLGLLGTERPPVHPQINDVFGNFNTLFLFAVDDLSGTFHERALRHHQLMAADLEHRHYSGFRVLRELNRLAGGSPRAAIPIFFNSVLDFGALADPSADGNAGASQMVEIEGSVHLPQILILPTLLEFEGKGLVCKWQAVEDAFLPGLVDDFLAAFGHHLERLAASDAAWNEVAPDLLPPAQRAAREAAWNAPDAARVLDERRQSRPDGVAGELWLGERPTGLLARTLTGGAVDVLGRPDEVWVEKSGRRIEVRRLEAALERHPGVMAAVVLPRRDGDGRTRLHAFVVPRDVRSGVSGLAEWLADQLPPHLVPETLEAAGELPRTADGAVDRAALAARLQSQPEPPAEPVAPRNETEAALLDIWQDLLGIRPSGVTEDFFALGGSSLLVVRLAARLQERFGLERPLLPSFFERPTIEHLAERLRQTERERLSPAAEAPSLLSRLLRFVPGGRRGEKQPAPVAEGGYSAAASMRTYLLLWFSQFVSGIGTGLGSFALGVWVYRQNASATQYALISFVATCTALLVGPLAGVLADRYDRRRLIILGDSGAAVMTSLMALALYTGQMRLWHVYFIVFFMVGFSALQIPALIVSTSMLVSRRQLGRVAGMTQAAGTAVGLICPPLSGALVPLIGYHGVIMIDITTFLFAFAVVLKLRLPSPAAADTSRERRPMWRDFLFGWAYLRQRPGLLALLAIFAATNFSLSTVQVLLTPLILSFGSATSLGFVNSASAAGALIGSVVLSVWGGPRNRVLGVLFFILLQAPLLLLGGLQPNVTLIAMAAFIYMGLGPFVGGLSQAIWQTKVAHEIQGRVFAIRSLIVNSTGPLAYLLAGPLADRVFEPLMAPGGPLADTVGRLIGVGKGRGVGLLFMSLGLFIILVVLLSSLNPRLRKVETELPDAHTDPEPVPAPAQGETRLQSA